MRKQVIECLGPSRELSMVPLGISVLRVKHALECIEADDEVQIRLPGVGAI
jgi:hypothetical protein